MKKLIAIICAVAVVATSLFGALMFTAVAEDTATEQAEAESLDNAKLAYWEDELGIELQLFPKSERGIPSNITSAEFYLVENTTKLPLTSLWKIDGSAQMDSSGKIPSYINFSEEISLGEYAGAVYYVEIPELPTVSYTYTDEGETETYSTNQFRFAPFRFAPCYYYDNGGALAKHSSKTWYIRELGALNWTSQTIVEYGVLLDSGWKGYVYTPFKEMGGTDASAKLKGVDLRSLYNATEEDENGNLKADIFRNSTGKVMKSYLPEDQSLVISEPIWIKGSVADTVAAPASLIIDGTEYDFNKGKAVTYPDASNLAGVMQSEFSSVGVYTEAHTGSVSTASAKVKSSGGTRTAIASISPLTDAPSVLASGFKHADSGYATADTFYKDNNSHTAVFQFAENTTLPDAGFLVYAELPQVEGEHRILSKHFLYDGTYSAKVNGVTGPQYTNILANVSPLAWYVLPEGETEWQEKTATYDSSNTNNNLSLDFDDYDEEKRYSPEFKGWIYIPIKSYPNATTSMSIEMLSLLVATYNADATKAVDIKFSAMTGISSFDPTTTIVVGDNNKVVDIATGEIFDIDYESPADFIGKEELINNGNLEDVLAVEYVQSANFTKSSLAAPNKFGVSVVSKYSQFTVNVGGTGRLVESTTAFKHPLAHITGAGTSSLGQYAYTVINYFDEVPLNVYDGYMFYLKNCSEENFTFNIQKYAKKIADNSNANAILGMSYFLDKANIDAGWTQKSRDITLEPGQEGFFYIPDNSATKLWHIRILKTQESSFNENYQMSPVMFVSNWATSYPGTALINGSAVAQNMFTGEFVVPNDIDKDMRVDILDLVNAAKRNNDAGFQEFRDSYLDNYVDELKVEELVSEAALTLKNDDVDYDLSLMDNPDRGYRSEVKIHFQDQHIPVGKNLSVNGTMLPDLLKEYNEANSKDYSIKVEANTVYDGEDFNSGVTEETAQRDTDYHILKDDYYPRGNGSGGAVYTLTKDAMEAWIDQYNETLNTSLGQEPLEKEDGESEEDFLSRATTQLINDYLTDELRWIAMMAEEMHKVVYLTDEQIAQVSWEGAWSDRDVVIDDKTIRLRRANGCFFYYEHENDMPGHREYNDDGTLKSIKFLVFHDPRTIFACDNQKEWDNALNTLFGQYNIGYKDVNNKTYYTREVTLGGVNSTITVANKLFNAYVTFTEFAYKVEDGEEPVLMPDGIMDALDYFFKFCVKRGAKANFRPAYNNYTQNAYLEDEQYEIFAENVYRECADEETMIAHIKQMAPVIAANKDAIHNISSGWIGFGGEMAAGYQRPPVSYKNVITAILEYHCVPNGLYFSSRSSEYIRNIVEGVDAVPGYDSGNKDLETGLAADPDWGGWYDPDTLLPSTEEDDGIWIEYIDYCGFNNDAFFGEQNFPGWGSGEYYQVGNSSYIYDTDNAYRAPNDGELYTNGSHVPETLVIKDGKYVWVGYDNPDTNYDDTDNKIPTGMEAILELAHHRYTDLSQWHGFLDTGKNDPNVMTFWMDHNALWEFDGDLDENAVARAAAITAPITKTMLDENNIPYDPTWIDSVAKDLNGDGKAEDFNAYEFIRDHLGYRIKAESGAVSISDVKWTGMSAQTTVNVSMDLKNYGFAAPFYMEAGFAILDANGNVITESPITGEVTNPDKWIGLPADYYSNISEYDNSANEYLITYTVGGTMNASLAKGTYKVAFFLRNSAKQGAQLANQIEYVNGYNVIYEFTVE